MIEMFICRIGNHQRFEEKRLSFKGSVHVMVKKLVDERKNHP